MVDLADYISKLVHHIVEIRSRALGSLLQKVEVGLVDQQDLIQYPTLAPHLLRLLHLGPHSLTPSVISLLLFLVQNECARKMLSSLGGRQQLQELHAVAPLHLLPQITLLINKLGQDSQATQQASEFRPLESEGEQTPESPQDSSLLDHLPLNCHHLGDHQQRSYMESLSEITFQDLPETPTESALTFMTFPWQALTKSDQHVLEGSTRSLLSHAEVEVRATLLFLDTVVVKDFPAEVLLQRPSVLQVVYGCLEEEGEDAWRLQGPACNFLTTLTSLLAARVDYFKNPHSMPGRDEVASVTSSGLASPSSMTRTNCCSPLPQAHTSSAMPSRFQDTGQGGEGSGPFYGVGQELGSRSVHEEDDGDEFILLGLHQVTVPSYCLRAIGAACPLLAARRPVLQSASLYLVTHCLDLLQLCINPDTLWHPQVKEEDGEEELYVPEVTAGIKMIIRDLCYLVVASHGPGRETDGKRWVPAGHCCSLVLWKLLTLLVPQEASPQVMDGDVRKALVLILYDAGFYLQHPDQHLCLLQYLTQADPTLANQVKCVLLAADSLQATSNFLQTPASDIQTFLDLAEKALPSSSIHQSTEFMERFVQGIGKQLIAGIVNEESLDRARDMLLQSLLSPLASVRRSGYKSVARLVEGSIGAAQTINTTCSQSPAVLLLMSPDVIRFLLYAGCVDEDREIARLSREIILGLLLGQPLMSAAVWAVAERCWRKCLPDLQCLAGPSTSLGRAVDHVSVTVCNQEDPEALRYQLQCLFLRSREARTEPFFQVCQRLAPMASDFHPDPFQYSIAIHNDLFILRQQVNMLRTCNLVSEEGGLVKVVELAVGKQMEPGVRKAAWTQLAFLLEDPHFHGPFLKLCSLQYLLITFINMLKREVGEGAGIECVPGAVESLRLLATHSQEVRASLLHHHAFLMGLLRATLLFYEDRHTRSQASCLMALVVFQDVIRHGIVETEALQARGELLSVPQLLEDNIHLPFLHHTHPWMESLETCPEIRTVHQVLQERNWPVLDFLGGLWEAAQVGGLEHVSPHPCQGSGQASGPLKLNNSDIDLLKLSVLPLSVQTALTGVENATSHRDVKHSVALLSFFIQQQQLVSQISSTFFTSPQWRQSFQRFLMSEPNSSVDEQLLVHVLECLGVCLKAHTQELRQHQQACPPLLQLVVTQLLSPSSPLLHTLSKAGGVSWVACDHTPRVVLSVRLFQAAAKLVGHTLNFLAECCPCSAVFGEKYLDTLAATLTTTLLPVLTANTDLQHYNLSVVGMVLECLLHATARGWPGTQLSAQLISNLIRLVSTFHLGRGRAHNSYVGRRVTLGCSLLLLHLFSHPDAELTQVIEEASREEHLSWLVSLWVYRDPLVASCGLSVAAALAVHSPLLHHSLRQVSGGVWAAALSYLLPPGRSCLVRASAALLLVQLTRMAPTPNSPWTSPVVADTLTGESVEGLEGLMTLLQHCNFYSLVSSCLASMNVSPGQVGVEPQPSGQEEWDLSLSFLSSYCGPWEENRGGPGENSSGNGSTSVQLYEATLRLLVNLVLLSPTWVIPQLFSHGIISLVVRQLRSVVGHIKTSPLHLQATETSLLLMGAVVKHQPARAAALAQDTGLEHLVLVVLSSNTLSLVSLEVLGALVAAGGGGAVRAVEWIAVSPSYTLPHVVAALHSSASFQLQAAAAVFIINLIQVALHGKISSNPELQTTLSGVLDTPSLLLNSEKVCPGWEVCRHLVQLVGDTPQPPDPSRPSDTPKGTSQSSAEHCHLLLECLKMLFLVSQSAKEAAKHYCLFLLPTLKRPFSAIQEKLTTINIYVTSQLTKHKDVKDDALACIQNLEVATNWISGRGSWAECVCESLIPLLHPLWAPAQHTLLLLKAVLGFILNATAHHQGCALVMRTSGLPGVMLSATRTKRPLLACITTTVCQQLAKLAVENRSLSHFFRDSRREIFYTSLSVLVNCARIQECVLVMNKFDLVKNTMKWLECRAAVEEGLPITCRVMPLLSLLTTHQESQLILCRSYHWVTSLQELVHLEGLQHQALRVLANMALNHHAAATLLASGGLLNTLLEVCGEQECEPWRWTALVIIWALVSNNQRGQAIMKQYPVQPLLKHLSETQDDKVASLAQSILDIL